MNEFDCEELYKIAKWVEKIQKDGNEINATSSWHVAMFINDCIMQYVSSDNYHIQRKMIINKLNDTKRKYRKLNELCYDLNINGDEYKLFAEKIEQYQYTKKYIELIEQYFDNLLTQKHFFNDVLDDVKCMDYHESTDDTVTNNFLEMIPLEDNFMEKFIAERTVSLNDDNHKICLMCETLLPLDTKRCSNCGEAFMARKHYKK